MSESESVRASIGVSCCALFVCVQAPTCPSNLGTGLRASSVMVKLEKFNELYAEPKHPDSHLLWEMCATASTCSPADPTSSAWASGRCSRRCSPQKRRSAADVRANVEKLKKK